MIFTNNYKKDKSLALLIDLSEIDLILHLGYDSGNHSYRVAMKSGAVLEITGVGLMAEWKKYKEKEKVSFSKIETI